MDIKTMGKDKQLFKICERCLFRVPVERSMCKTCGCKKFAHYDEEAVEQHALYSESMANVPSQVASAALARMQDVLRSWQINIDGPSS